MDRQGPGTLYGLGRIDCSSASIRVAAASPANTWPEEFHGRGFGRCVRAWLVAWLWLRIMLGLHVQDVVSEGA